MKQDRPRTYLVEVRFKERVDPPSVAYLVQALHTFAEANDTHILSEDHRESGLRFEVMLERAYTASVRNPFTDPRRTS